MNPYPREPIGKIGKKLANQFPYYTKFKKTRKYLIIIEKIRRPENPWET